jgi:ketosteroid isomerase-like protein
MKRIFLMAFLAAVAACPASGQQAQRKTSQNSSATQREISQLESRRLQAMVQVDAAVLDRILADDLVYTHTTGWVDTKAEFLAHLKSRELEYQSIHLEEAQVRVYGNAAVVTGRATMRVKSKRQELLLPLRFTDVYVIEDGRWRMVTWQSTRITQQ